MWKRWGGVFDIPGKREQAAALQKKTEAPEFWNDPKAAEAFLKNLGSIKSWVTSFDKAATDVDDLDVLYDFARESLGDVADEAASSPESQELDETYSRAMKEVEDLELKNMLGAEGDNLGAILTINSGAGGTESNDWSSMLMRMYMRWGERNGYKVTVTDMQEGDEAGIKSATIEFEGEYAYGYLKAENGVHRLVRISPFNAQGKRQTSFVSCEVMPELPQDNNIEINPDDIRIDTYRSSGAGGQHINKTSSAIRITHFPTGIVVTCQNERSQFQNKDKAFEMLRAKLFLLQQEMDAEKLDGIRGDVKEIAWGSQIRSYFLQPYTLVKDTRTEEETSDAQGVLNGDIDRFINAYLKMQAQQRKTKVQ